MYGLFHGGDIELSQWIVMFVFWGGIIAVLIYLVGGFKKRDDK
jgi:hypothetical protein